MRRVSLLTALSARFTASNPSRQADYRAATLNQPKERPLELTWRRAWAILSYGDPKWVLWEQCRVGACTLKELGAEDRAELDEIISRYDWTCDSVSDID